MSDDPCCIKCGKPRSSHNWFGEFGYLCHNGSNSFQTEAPTTPSPEGEIEGLIAELRVPHFMDDDDYARAPESIAETVKLMRKQRERAATALERLSQSAQVMREVLGDCNAALKELLATVEGECPSLLDEDSGGSARLDMAIEDALLQSDVLLGRCPSCRGMRTWVPTVNCREPLHHEKQDSWVEEAKVVHDARKALAALPSQTGEME